jgi:hypothetical protein
MLLRVRINYGAIIANRVARIRAAFLLRTSSKRMRPFFMTSF